MTQNKQPMELIIKITYGWVAQEFDIISGKCIGQRFYAENIVEYEKLDGDKVSLRESVDPYSNLSHPFNMEQPNDTI